jgi:hypothetical protein
MTCKEIETRMYPDRDKERIGGRNIVADMLYEVAVAIGFNMDLLKDGFNKDKNFKFLEDDYEAFQDFMEAAKSPEGKRLRCKDYKGATGIFIEQMGDFFLLLAAHNGVEPSQLREQWLKICVKTNCEGVRWCIREMTDELEEDIENRYFMTPYIAEDGFTDDNVPEIAKLVFLQFILGNIDEDMSDIRGTYWFFKMKYEENQYRELHEAGDYLRSLSAEQFDQFKKDIHDHLQYDKIIDADDELARMTDEWLKIEDGQGKLQDIKKQKKKFEQIVKRRNHHAEEIFKGMDNRVEMLAAEKKGGFSLSEQFDIAYERIFDAFKEYRSFQAYRDKVPMTEDNEKIMEIEFEQRFGVAMYLGKES